MDYLERLHFRKTKTNKKETLKGIPRSHGIEDMPDVYRADAMDQSMMILRSVVAAYRTMVRIWCD